MATIGPIEITSEWTKVYDCSVSGDFSGGIQGVGSGLIYVRVSDTSLLPEDKGGFQLGADIYPFAASDAQVVWARTATGLGAVVMG